jgi:hypothetical protein
MRPTLLIFIALFAHTLSNIVSAQTPPPKFSDYPVSETFTGKNARVVLTQKDRMYQTRLRDAGREKKPNFAGHYILTIWGCGTSCVMGAIIDAKTGRVHWWDFSVCCWGSDVDDKAGPIQVKLNSRLIIFFGARNEKDGDIGSHYYKFEKGKFVHLKSTLNQSQDWRL